MVFAYYYNWYRGYWLKRTVRASDPPVLGQYNNTIYCDEILDHIKQMRYAGIDFMSVSWDPRVTNYENMMDSCLDTGFKMCVFYESLANATGKNQAITKSDLPRILNDMRALGQDLGEDCWLRIDGKPVVMIYVTRNYADPQEAFPAIREALGRDVYLVGDEIFWKRPDPKRIKVFDSVTAYNFYQAGRFEGNGRMACDSFLKNVHSTQAEALEICQGTGIQYWPVIMPGYDDSGVRPKAGHPPIPRLEGYFYRESWKRSLEYQSDVYSLCSFNEWYEDSAVEPASSYGNLYLDITREFK